MTCSAGNCSTPTRMNGELSIIVDIRIDLYVTGEQNLYLLEYAKYKDVNVLVYSHNYTELPDVRAFAERIAGALNLDMKGHLGDSHW